MPAGTNEPAWLTIARSDLAAGVKEVPGKGAHPRIIEMYENAGLAHSGDDDQSWCGCATGTWLKGADYPTPPNFYGAKMFETYGAKVEPDQWQMGDIGVFYRTPLRERDWKRHVGLIVGETKTHWKLLGGNQRVPGEKVDGVTITNIAKKDLSALRRPIAATPKALAAAGDAEMAMASDMKKLAVTTAATSVAGATVNAAMETPAPAVDVKQIADDIGMWNKVLEGGNALVKLAVANPWLIAAALGAVVAWRLALRWERARVKRAQQGVGSVGAG